VLVLAQATGWSEDYLRHELPLCRGYAYYHAARLLAGEKCRWPGKRGKFGKWVDQVKGWVRGLKSAGEKKMRGDENNC
jgi:hypothetical protein